MTRWYQRQSWYIEKPMPFVMILAWPFLWLWGTVWELRRHKVGSPSKDVYTCYRDNRGCDTPKRAKTIWDDQPDLVFELDDPTEAWDTQSEWNEMADDWDRHMLGDGWTHTGYVYGQKLYTKGYQPFPVDSWGKVV